MTAAAAKASVDPREQLEAIIAKHVPAGSVAAIADKVIARFRAGDGALPEIAKQEIVAYKKAIAVAHPAAGGPAMEEGEAVPPAPVKQKPLSKTTEKRLLTALNHSQGSLRLVIAVPPTELDAAQAFLDAKKGRAPVSVRARTPEDEARLAAWNDWSET